jgi:hypothetical protein
MSILANEPLHIVVSRTNHVKKNFDCYVLCYRIFTTGVGEELDFGNAARAV